MRAAADDVGRPHQNAHAGLVRSSRRLQRGREFRQTDAVRDRLVDMGQRRVVMAGERHAGVPAMLRDRLAVHARIAGRLLLAGRDIAIEGLVGHAALGLVVERVLLHRLELPLARRVVHERGKPHVAVLPEPVERIEHVGRRDLAAQVQQMLGAQPAVALRSLDCIGKQPHLVRIEAAILVRAHAQAVEHGRDARRRDLRVMCLDRRDRIPPHPGAGRIVAFEMVGMQLDQPRDQVVAIEILADRAGGRHVRDKSVADQHRPGLHLVAQDDGGVAEHGFLRHADDFPLAGGPSVSRSRAWIGRLGDLHDSLTNDRWASRRSHDVVPDGEISRCLSAVETLSKTKTTIRIRITM